VAGAVIESMTGGLFAESDEDEQPNARVAAKKSPEHLRTVMMPAAYAAPVPGAECRDLARTFGFVNLRAQVARESAGVAVAARRGQDGSPR
jgi:hypothetical protein